MNIRMAKHDEIAWLMEEGYKEWSKNRTFEKYCTDNMKEDSYGTRYVLDINGEIVSSIILLQLEKIHEKQIYGIGSVLTHQYHRGKGYANILLNHAIKLVDEVGGNIIFLFSDINASFYEKLNFRVLPSKFQKHKNSPIMAYCNDIVWNDISNFNVEVIPDYF